MSKQEELSPEEKIAKFKEVYKHCYEIANYPNPEDSDDSDSDIDERDAYDIQKDKLYEIKSLLNDLYVFVSDHLNIVSESEPEIITYGKYLSRCRDLKIFGLLNVEKSINLFKLETIMAEYNSNKNADGTLSTNNFCELIRNKIKQAFLNLLDIQYNKQHVEEAKKIINILFNLTELNEYINRIFHLYAANEELNQSNFYSAIYEALKPYANEESLNNYLTNENKEKLFNTIQENGVVKIEKFKFSFTMSLFYRFRSFCKNQIKLIINDTLIYDFYPACERNIRSNPLDKIVDDYNTLFRPEEE